MSNGFLLSIFANVVTAVLLALVVRAYYRYRRRVIVPTVRIEPTKIIGKADVARVRPDFLIAILSPIHPPNLPIDVAEDDRRRQREAFEKQLDDGDFIGLKLSASSLSVGHTIRAIGKYPSLKAAYLITTPTSERGSRAVQRYVAESLQRACKVIADASTHLSLENDAQVTRDAYERTKGLLESLGRARTLVDVTGGMRSIQVGVLLACLGRNQDVQLIGSPYDDAGNPITHESFPVVIHFEPEIPERRE
jgi:hypothetical protein